MQHIPVLLKEVIQFGNPKPGETLVDVTVGGGGYAKEMISALHRSGVFLGIDWDEAAIVRATKNFAEMQSNELKIYLIEENFAELPRAMQKLGLTHADLIVADLGFSSLQLETSGRGFSFNRDEPLLMTYSDKELPVREILKTIREKELEAILGDMSQERYAKRIAHAIIERERKDPITTSHELAEVVKSAVPENYESHRIHPATRTFLALRMYANHELENLERFLKQLPNILRKNGRAVMVSFQSQEDALVKKYFLQYKRDGNAKILTKKPIEATFEEISENPRSRSAKLRAVQFI